MFGIRKFDAIVALYIFGIMVVELMGAKVMPLGSIGGLHLSTSVAIFVLPLLFTLTDAVTEVHGRERTRSLIRLGLLIVLLQVITAALFTVLPSDERFTWGSSAYDMIFGTSIRFGLASIAAFAVAEFLDVAVFAKIRELLGNRRLWLRNNASNFLSQFIDVLVWTTIAFYGFGDSFASNAAFILGMIVPYWLVRCAISLAQTPMIYVAVNWLKKEKAAQGA